MPRKPEPYWVEGRRAYYTRAGGRKTRLNYPDGSPVARGDHAGLTAALAVLLGRRARESAGRDLRVGEVFQAFLDWSRLAERRRATVDGHRQILSAIGRHRHRRQVLGELPAADLGVEHWASYQGSLQGRGLAPRTIRAHLASLKACWRWAARPVVGREPERLIAHDPFRDMLVELRSERRRVRGTIDRAGVARLLEAVDASAHPEGWRLAVRVQAECGCRTGEALSLRWAWWKGTHFEVPADQHKTGRKIGRPRILAVTRATAARVEELKGRARGEYVVEGRWSDHPASMNVYQQRFAAAVKAAGLDPATRPYWLRDYVANELRRAGIGGRLADDTVGNAAGVRARHYESTDPAEVVAAVERVAGLTPAP